MRPIAILAHENRTFGRQVFEMGSKDVIMTQCTFINCKDKERGGALWTYQCRTKISKCLFEKNSAKVSGSVEFADSPLLECNDTIITESTAERFGAGHFDGHDPSNKAIIFSSNFTDNKADRWIGGIRLQHNGGEVRFCNFHRNAAYKYGAIWDYGHFPANRNFSYLSIINNTAETYGAGITCYHLLYSGSISSSLFLGNRNGDKSDGRSIYLEGDNSLIHLTNCSFEGSKSIEVSIYHPASIIEDVGNRFAL